MSIMTVVFFWLVHDTDFFSVSQSFWMPHIEDAS
jgi:hypothetical protein